ncbi:TPA: Txe/YoeB family addiction module toxin [Aeromonas hydrophila]|nr:MULTISPECIES: Txe/YoeB family addiction module toxin [Aeromonas]MCK0185765.1 Txe/YoeB family addiction module toxin [Aeromonas hydrophila]UOV91915.1 Txe/YoeB family addiction module toxin [Aeromonas hydrophila]
MMVAFVVFNELSLPLSDNNWEYQVKGYIELVNMLRANGVSSIRVNHHFKDLSFFTESKSLPAFMGGLPNGDIKTRLRSLLTNQSSFFESPLIRDDEHAQKFELTVDSEYYLDGNVNNGGLACAHIWNTFSVNFHTSERWLHNSILLEKAFADGTSQDAEVLLLTNAEHYEYHHAELSRLITKPKSSDELFVFCDIVSTLYIYRVSFSEQAGEELPRLLEKGGNYLDRVYELIKSIKITPSEGIGKPEKLKENLAGFSSRRIDAEHRLVYRIVSDNHIEISQCLGHY